jgi:hypothetical protein
MEMVIKTKRELPTTIHVTTMKTTTTATIKKKAEVRNVMSSDGIGKQRDEESDGGRSGERKQR